MNLKGKTRPLSYEEAHTELEKVKELIGMKGVKSDPEEVKRILKKAGSLSDELIKSKYD
jgi:uncharacterized Zn finger protein